MEQKIISDSVPAVMKKNKKPKVSENVKKVKERIIHSNTLLQLYKGKEKEMEQYTTELANLKEKLSKSDSQLFVLNKESEIFRQAAQQYKKEATDLKQQLEEKNTQLRNQKLLDDDIQQLRRENDEFSKKIRVLETLKGRLEHKINENKLAKMLSENERHEIIKLKKDLEIKDEEIRRNQSEADKIKDELKLLRNSEEELQDKILERDFRIAIMDETITENTSTIAELNKQLDIAQTTCLITELSGSMCLMSFLRQNFTLEKFDVLTNILNEIICGLDTPIYLNIYSNIIDDETKSYPRKSSLKNPNDIKLPVILPDKEKDIILFLVHLISEEYENEFFEKILFWISDKIISYKDENLNLGYISRLCRLFVAICRTLNEIQRVRILCYDICREKTNNNFVLSILANTAVIWPCTLKMPNDFDYDVIESLKKGHSIFLNIFECIAVDCIKEIKDSNISKLEETFTRFCSWNQTHEVPSLQEIFDNLINFVSSPEFHEFCNQMNNMDNIAYIKILLSHW
ncbi:18605_t:CDS:10 [Entrophospora sp. SA101]|nr:10935_t:CDS:10 [Entrophospora sp. SA101]CAJ0751257.1 20177_t:CDS:10 [Entrophospora sp. SA101]CAJ0755979.1 18605_t:CDS:10 [Entrophospora sp. SA101]